MTAFQDLVPIEYPIVAFSHCRDVVVAVSRAGGLGVLGANTFSAEQLELELAWIDEHIGGHPYGVNVLAPTPFMSDDDLSDPSQHASQIPERHREFVADLMNRLSIPAPKTDAVPMPFGDGGLIVTRHGLQERIDVAMRHPVRMLVSALGPFDKDVVVTAKEAGILIGGMCGSPRHAKAHRDAGADVVIAQGVEAAGHTGEIATMVLVPQVVDAVAPLPVLAAGGIGSGRQIAAALALGAQGVWMGSVWLTTLESDVEVAGQAKMLAATSEDTLRSRCITGKPVRFLRLPWNVAWEDPDAPQPLSAPLQGNLMKPLLAGVYENRVEEQIGSSVGQVVGMMNTRSSVRNVLNELMEEFATTLVQLNDAFLDGA